jgi:hypothetical protein
MATTGCVLPSLPGGHATLPRDTPAAASAADPARHPCCSVAEGTAASADSKFLTRLNEAYEGDGKPAAGDAARKRLPAGTPATPAPVEVLGNAAAPHTTPPVTSDAFKKSWDSVGAMADAYAGGPDSATPKKLALAEVREQDAEGRALDDWHISTKNPTFTFAAPPG